MYGAGTYIEPTIIAINRWSWNYLLSLIGVTQCLEEGLMDRTFYKNVIFGPKLWVDKGDPLRSWTFPEIRDTIAIRTGALCRFKLTHSAQFYKIQHAIFLRIKTFVE